MGESTRISADLKELIHEACDGVIDDWGKDCTLLFPPARQDCPNCWYDSVHQRSSNLYQPGGPVPFEPGMVCPYCEGVGWREEQVSQSVRLRIAWSPAEFFRKFPPMMILPEGAIQSKGYLTDLPRVLQSRRLLVETSISPVIQAIYELWTEPADSHDLVQGRYFVATWRRAGG